MITVTGIFGIEEKKLQYDYGNLGKDFAILIGLLYIIGIVTVNSYLLRLGTFEFSLLRTQFVATGALAFVIYFFTGVTGVEFW